MDESTAMYYCQLLRSRPTDSLTNEDIAAYMRDRGAEVTLVHDELLIRWPPGTGFYE